jgi:membrane-bound ClpP family serine protease
MRAIDGMRIAAWTCLLAGAALIVWEAASGGASNVLFNIGVVAMISGSVLRVYGKYTRGKGRDPGLRKSADDKGSIYPHR